MSQRFEDHSHIGSYVERSSIQRNDSPRSCIAFGTKLNIATAQASDLGMWFEVCYQAGSDLDSFYFPGEPLALGFGGAEVDSVLENNLNIAPQGDYIFAAASTTSA